MKAQKLRGREVRNCAKIFSMVVALFICLMLQPLKATVWESGHHEIVDSDVYGEIDIYNDVTLDIFGGDIFRLAAFDTTITNWHDGQMDVLWARDNSIVNIYGGNLNRLGILENGLLNLYAYDVTYYETGGHYDRGWLEGRYVSSDQYFTFDFFEPGTYSHINVIPEPTTLLLLSLGSFILIKRK